MGHLKSERDSQAPAFTAGPMPCIERTVSLALGFSPISEQSQPWAHV